ncbi:MAG: hypothetical protein M3R04_01915 [bacterium]|nr:hypothetical protein [bacterium]
MVGVLEDSMVVRKHLPLLMSAFCLLLLLTACAGQSAPVLNQGQPALSGVPTAGMPGIFDLDGLGERTLSAIGDDPITVLGNAELFDFNGSDNSGEPSLTLIGNGEGPDSPDQLAWAVYQISGLDETSDAQSISVQASVHGDHDTYFVGLSNYSQGHWTWHGPFHAAEAQIDLSHDGDRYISHEGNMYFNVTTHQGVVTHHQSTLQFGHDGHGNLPGMPFHLSATDGEFTDHVNLTWEGGTGATSFEVWRAVHGDHHEFTHIGSTQAREFADAGVEPGVAYSYKVRAVNDAGHSEFSSQDTGFASSHHEGDEDCPSDLSASDGTHHNGIALAWHGDHAQTYNIYRRLDTSDHDFEFLAHVQGLEYFDEAVEAGQVYVYKIGLVRTDRPVCFSNADQGHVGGGEH